MNCQKSLKNVGKLVKKKTPHILGEFNNCPEIFSLSGALEISRARLVSICPFVTVILQNQVIGCPCNEMQSNFASLRVS